MAAVGGGEARFITPMTHLNRWLPLHERACAFVCILNSTFIRIVKAGRQADTNTHILKGR